MKGWLGKDVAVKVVQILAHSETHTHTHTPDLVKAQPGILLEQKRLVTTPLLSPKQKPGCLLTSKCG